MSGLKLIPFGQRKADGQMLVPKGADLAGPLPVALRVFQAELFPLVPAPGVVQACVVVLRA